MEFPGDLKFTGSDEWIKADGDTATLGVTDFAQDQLSDIVYFEIGVGVGDVISKGDEVAILESVEGRGRNLFAGIRRGNRNQCRTPRQPGGG